MDGIAAAVEAVRSHWPRPLGLGLAWLLAVMIGVAVAAVVPEQLLYIPAVFFVLIGAALTALWFIGRIIPKCPLDRVGFLIAISVEDERVYPIFRRDFIKNLERQLCSGQLQQRIWVGEVPQCRMSGPPSEAEAIALRGSTRSTFVLHGEVRTRQEGGRKHYIDLSGVVGHAETADQNKTRLRGEFSELLPRRIIAEEGTELPAFELTSSLSSLAAAYIAGIAAYLSGFLDAAGDLYRDAEALAARSADKHEVSKKILERLPTRFSEICITRARARYEAWRTDRDPGDLAAMCSFINEAPARAHELTEWKALKAIGMVATAGGELGDIEKLVLKLPERDPVTQMNLAFFDVARGDLKSAARHYRNADAAGVTVETIEEVMSFFDWYKEYRPEVRSEVSYALGFIACHLLRDKKMAAKAFQEFRETRGGRFHDEDVLVDKWLSCLPAVA